MTKKDKERDKELEAAIATLRKKYGEGAVMILGKEKPQDVEVISTGSLALDLALGVGGIPKGRVTEIFGPEMSGKTTLCYSVIAEVQRLGGRAAYIDTEHNMDPTYAQKVGVNLEELVISQPEFGEQALEITEALVKTHAIGVVVIDSVAGLVPRAELEGEIGDYHVGRQARLMSQALRMLVGSIRVANAVVIFTNQIRMKIGTFYGSPETTPGGLALKFYTAVRLDIRRATPIKDAKGEIIGSEIKAFVRKNKVASPFKTAYFDIIFGKGISKAGDIISLGVQHGVLEKRGSFFAFGEETLGRGKEKARQFLEENPEVMDRIEIEIRNVFGKKGKEEKRFP